MDGRHQRRHIVCFILSERRADQSLVSRLASKDEVLRGSLRPLEETWQAWYTEDNLENYFNVARDVLVKQGVAELNPEFNPSEPYPQEIIITAPERICI